MLIARQSTARTVTVGPVLDADGVAVTTAVVGDFKIAKNGGAPAALNGSATLTHRNTGHYSLALTASDLDTVGQAEVVIDATTNACPVKEITVVEEAVYDALFAASAPGYVANAPVNVAQISGQGASADALEALLDGTGADVTVLTLSVTAGVEISQSGTGDPGVLIAGNGSGPGLQINGGSSGRGVLIQSAGNANGVHVVGSGTGHGLYLQSGSGATGNAMTLAAASTNGHGLKSTGAGTGDGAELTAGASGADLDADIAGTLTAVTTATNVTTVNGLAAGVITAASIANGAIDAATFAADVDAEFLSYIVDDATRIDASALNTASAAVGSNGSGLTEAGGTGDHLTAVPWNASWDAEVQSEVDDALIAKGLDHLVFTSVTGTDVADNSIVAQLVSKSATADWDSYVNTTDSLEANRDNIGTAGAGLTAADDAVITAIGALNNITAASVWAVGTRTLTAGTNIDGSTFTAVPWNSAWDAEVQSEVQDALVANNLDHLVLSAVDTDFATTVHADSVIGQLAQTADGGFSRASDSLEAIRDRGDAAWVTATGFSTHSAADVWAVATRVLTAGTNIVLAKGTGVTGFNDLSAAQVNAEADAALADYDPPTNAEMEARTLAAASYATAAGVSAVETDTQDIQSRLPAALVNSRMDCTIDATGMESGAIDAIWDEAMTELAAVPGVTASLRDALRWVFLVSRNKLVQTTTTQTLRNDADSATIATSTVSDDGTTFTRGEFS